MIRNEIIWQRKKPFKLSKVCCGFYWFLEDLVSWILTRFPAVNVVAWRATYQLSRPSPYFWLSSLYLKKQNPSVSHTYISLLRKTVMKIVIRLWLWQDWNERELQVPLLRDPREGQLCAQPHGPQLAAPAATGGQETCSQVRRSATGPVNPGQKFLQILWKNLDFIE